MHLYILAFHMSHVGMADILLLLRIGYLWLKHFNIVTTHNIEIWNLGFYCCKLKSKLSNLILRIAVSCFVFILGKAGNRRDLNLDYMGLTDLWIIQRFINFQHKFKTDFIYFIIFFLYLFLIYFFVTNKIEIL